MKKIYQNLFSTKAIFGGLLGILLLVSCKPSPKKVVAEAIVENPEYLAALQEWQNERFTKLKAKDGWLNLAGLFWLKEGENTIGADTSNTIQLPKGKSDDFVGVYNVANGKILFTANPSSTVSVADSIIVAAPVFPSENPLVLEHKNLAWFIIQRGDNFAIRLRDYESALAQNFTGVETYPFTETWKVRAKWVPPIAKFVQITDVTDRVSEQESAGTLHFEIEGKPLSLAALESGEKLFVIFGDATNSGETYDSGRFIFICRTSGRRGIHLARF